MKRDRIGAFAGRGGRAMTPRLGGSKARAMASATELSMFTHRICRGVMGSIRPNRIAMIRLMLSPPFTGSRKAITFLRLSWTVRPCRTASAIEAKLSSASTRSDASRAACEPFWPIAMPASARFSAGASFTPSPVIATTAPGA